MNSKKELSIKIITSIFGGIICGLMSYFFLGFVFLRALIDSSPTQLMVIFYFITIIPIGLFIWAFYKSATIKRMWGKIVLSIGIIILSFPLAAFIMLITMSVKNTEENDIMGIMFLSSTFATICLGVLCIVLSAGFIVGAYFLLRKDV